MTVSETGTATGTATGTGITGGIMAVTRMTMDGVATTTTPIKDADALDGR